MSTEFRCPNCKAPIAEGQTFCGNCKTDIVWKSKTPRASIPQTIQKIALGLLCLVLLVMLMQHVWAPEQRRQTISSQTVRVGKVTLEVKSAVYEYGYLKVHAIATNTGDKDIFSPCIKCIAWDTDCKTILGTDTAWPADMMLSTFKVGQSAAIDFHVHVSGEPAQCRYTFEASDFLLDVKYPPK